MTRLARNDRVYLRVDGHPEPGVVVGVTYGREAYDVRLENGTTYQNVSPEWVERRE